MKKIDIACIIDDDPVFVFGTKKMLQLADFCKNFMVFQNGQEALHNLKAIIENGSKLPEVILLDLNMPVMDGWQFLEAFIETPTPKKIHIYIVSSSLNPKDIDRAKNYKCVNNYIIKPIALDKIKGIVGELEQL